MYTCFRELVRQDNGRQTRKLKDVCTMQYGYTETATTDPVGSKFLRITDIAQPSIDWSEVPYCPITKDDHSKYVLSEGDVVVARTGATVGVAKMMMKNIPDAVFASFLVRIKPVDPTYMYCFGLEITSPDFLNYVQTNAGGSAQPQANPPLLGEYELSVPAKDLLPEFNSRIRTILNAIELYEVEVSKLKDVRNNIMEMISRR